MISLSEEIDEQLPAPLHAAPGTLLGNYVLHERIGQGSMGAVYRAEHTLLRKAVALKIMAAPLLDDDDARERFLREGQAAAALKHPNVVDVTDVGVYGATPFLVMELLEGEDLEALLHRRKQLDEAEVAELIVPIVAALASAHDQGIVHRDLKPSNIFVARGSDGEITPKVLDFGICKLAQTLGGPDLQATPFNQVLGSPLYLSPEAMKGSCHVSDRCDQYSLGVVLYECVVGHPPFVAESLFALLSAILAGEFARPKASRPGISSKMEAVILRAMQADPELRFRDMRELGRALLQVARPRTQLLWGPAFARSEPSHAISASQMPTVLSLEPASRARRASKPSSNRKPSYLRSALSILVVGYVITKIVPTWEEPAASHDNPVSALPAPVASPAEPVASVTLAGTEPLPRPAPISVVTDTVSAPVTAPLALGEEGEARKPVRGKALDRSRPRISRPGKTQAATREKQTAKSKRQRTRAPAGSPEGVSSGALANEAPILK